MDHLRSLLVSMQIAIPRMNSRSHRLEGLEEMIQRTRAVTDQMFCGNQRDALLYVLPAIMRVLVPAHTPRPLLRALQGPPSLHDRVVHMYR